MAGIFVAATPTRKGYPLALRDVCGGSQGKKLGKTFTSVGNWQNIRSSEPVLLCYLASKERSTCVAENRSVRRSLSTGRIIQFIHVRSSLSVELIHHQLIYLMATYLDGKVKTIRVL